MGEALINAMCRGHYQAFSAGSRPTGAVHPQALSTLKKHHLLTDQLRSKSWDEFADWSFDLLITVCDDAAKEACPVRVGKHQQLHWSIPDPASVQGSTAQVTQAFEATCEMLRMRIKNELLTLGD